MTAEQERLVVENMHIVPAIAKQLMKRFSLPFWIELEEMISCGYVGLCNAALGFDPERGVKFGTYAHFKIRGAIIDDFLRRQPPIHESINGTSDVVTANGATNSGYKCLTYAREAAFFMENPNEPCDPTPSAEETIMEAQEQRRKCRHLAFASKSVTAIELRAAVSKHSEGKTLREIGAEQGRSASWAHYRVHCGERQLREALLDPAANDA